MKSRILTTLCLIVASLLLATCVDANDAWVDTGIGAISPQGNVLAIERFNENMVIVFSWDNGSATWLVFFLDNDGNLVKSPIFGFEFIYLDVYPRYVKVYGAHPGTGWKFLFDMEQ